MFTAVLIGIDSSYVYKNAAECESHESPDIFPIGCLKLDCGVSPQCLKLRYQRIQLMFAIVALILSLLQLVIYGYLYVSVRGEILKAGVYHSDVFNVSEHIKLMHSDASPAYAHIYDCTPQVKYSGGKYNKLADI
jgi:hypothetical protein